MNSSRQFTLITVFFATLFAIAAPAQQRTPDVVYVPTPHEAVAKMLEMAEVDENDLVYDLGCGDGRIPVTAAKKYGAHGVGIDIDPERIKESKENAQKEGVTDKVKFIEADLFKTNIRPATAVTLYLLPELNLRLRPRLLKMLKPGTPIVSHDFDMGDWEPERTEYVDGPTRRHTLYRWTVPEHFAGTWQVKPGEGGKSFELQLTQNEFRVNGKVLRDGREIELKDGKLEGDKISFALENEQRFSGHLKGNTIEGVLTGAAHAQPWTATRVRTAAKKLPASSTAH